MSILAPITEGRIRLFGMVLMLCLFVVGCATAPPQMIYVPSDMLPEGSGVAKLQEKPALFAGQTLVIAPVTGIGASNMRALSGALGVSGTTLIWGQTFHEALFKALRGSGLFGEVARDGTAPYILHADILQQSTVGYGATFKVHYVLNDTQSGRDIWGQDITASYVFPSSAFSFFTPYNTQSKALMRACGKNIESLIENLGIRPNNTALEPTASVP